MEPHDALIIGHRGVEFERGANLWVTLSAAVQKIFERGCNEGGVSQLKNFVAMTRHRAPWLSF